MVGLNKPKICGEQPNLPERVIISYQSAAPRLRLASKAAGCQRGTKSTSISARVSTRITLVLEAHKALKWRVMETHVAAPECKLIVAKL